MTHRFSPVTRPKLKILAVLIPSLLTISNSHALPSECSVNADTSIRCSTTGNDLNLTSENDTHVIGLYVNAMTINVNGNDNANIINNHVISGGSWSPVPNMISNIRLNANTTGEISFTNNNHISTWQGLSDTITIRPDLLETAPGSGHYYTNTSPTASKMTVTNNGHLAAYIGSNASGINFLSTKIDDLYINNTGLISIDTIDNSNGIIVSSLQDAIIIAPLNKGNVTVNNTGDITLFRGNHGIYIRTEGNINIFSSGTVNVNTDIQSFWGGGLQGTAIQAGNWGVNGESKTANITVEGTSTEKALVKITNKDGGYGLVAYNGGMPTNLSTTINVSNYAEIDATKANSAVYYGAYIIDPARAEYATLNIAETAEVKGGRTSAIALEAYSSGHFIVNNNGHVGSMNDVLFTVDNTSRSAGIGNITINNHGNFTGRFNLQVNNTTKENLFNNHGIWHLRATDYQLGATNTNVYDNNYGDDKYSLSVASSLFSNSTINNTGTIYLSNYKRSDGNPLVIDSTGQYLVDGSLIHDMNNGAYQAHILGNKEFINSGVIDLTDNQQSTHVGNVFLITDSTNAGVAGNSNYISAGGSIIINTVLNQGGNVSTSDVVVIDNAILLNDNVNNATKLFVNNVGGSGAATGNDGIKVIEVRGTSDANSFTLGHVVREGIYEYILRQGTEANPTNQSWFLTSFIHQTNLVNPDIGTYLTNKRKTTSLFMHSLHDRLGEPQYTESGTKETIAPSAWVRVVTGHEKTMVAKDNLSVHSEDYLVHTGFDIAQWTTEKDERYHIGIMGAAGNSSNTTTSKLTNSKVKGQIEGYGAGMYFTYYNNESMPEGFYADIWSMYNWFDNTSESMKKYKSNAWNNSIEMGYAYKFNQSENWQWMIEPHAQVVYSHYRADSFTDNRQLKVDDEKGDSFHTRLGARAYLRDATHIQRAQPFIELNWLYNNTQNSLDFDNIRLTDDTPNNRVELKTGIHGQIKSGLDVYSHIGLQWGKNHYENTEGQIGIKYRF